MTQQNVTCSKNVKHKNALQLASARRFEKEEIHFLQEDKRTY